MPITEGTRLGSYEITSLLGSGGMGQVYRAKDLKLGRDVAIKVLREELAADPERLRRFEQEARSASALNHPNIITIYDIGKHGDTPYIAMEYVEGKTLRELLAEGPLPTKRLLQLATQIAEGLAKAHSAGIIHRDLKPENLMVSGDWYIKILDFGLAKLLAQPGVDSDADTMTKEGTVAGAVMGTLSYMSPEQALGKPLDARTDVFSLGAVLYEMATGQKPFQGETPAGLFNEILNKTPATPSSFNSGLPGDFDRVIGRALNKESSERYPSARELLSDLNTIRLDTPVLEVLPQKSIVVLPFENISPDPDQEYFCDGMTEEIISDLSTIQSLRVISRTSAMQLKGTDKDIGTIGTELKVQYILEGSVRKAANNLRITAQLIDSTNDAHLWAEKYSGTLDDVFDIQEKVSRSIVDALKLKLSPQADKKIAERPIENVHAYECYLRARQEILRPNEEGMLRALQLINNGMEIVGENARLHAGMGYIYWQYVCAGLKPDELSIYTDKTEEHAKRAVDLDTGSAQGYFLHGLISIARGKLQEAVWNLKRSLDLEQDNPDALFYLAMGYSFAGKEFAARPLADRLLEIDPLTAFNYTLPGWLDYVRGDFEAALAKCRKAFQMGPENLLIQYFFMHVLAGNRRLEDLYSLVDQMNACAPQSSMVQCALFMKKALQNDKIGALQFANKETSAYARCYADTSYTMAGGYALIEMKEEAFDWLTHGISRGFINYPFLSKYDRLLENLHQDKRFKLLMERVKHEWEHFEV